MALGNRDRHGFIDTITKKLIQLNLWVRGVLMK